MKETIIKYFSSKPVITKDGVIRKMKEYLTEYQFQCYFHILNFVSDNFIRESKFGIKFKKSGLLTMESGLIVNNYILLLASTYDLVISSQKYKIENLKEGYAFGNYSSMETARIIESDDPRRYYPFYPGRDFGMRETKRFAEEETRFVFPEIREIVMIVVNHLLDSELPWNTGNWIIRAEYPSRVLITSGKYGLTFKVSMNESEYLKGIVFINIEQKGIKGTEMIEIIQCGKKGWLEKLMKEIEQRKNIDNYYYIL